MPAQHTKPLLRLLADLDNAVLAIGLLLILTMPTLQGPIQSQLRLLALRLSQMPQLRLVAMGMPMQQLHLVASNSAVPVRWLY